MKLQSCETWYIETIKDIFANQGYKWQLITAFCSRKGECILNQTTANRLREQYPNHVPLDVAAQYLSVSPRRLSKLIAEGRQPFASIGANIGTGQNYTRVYTERLIAYLNGTLPIEK